MQWPVPLSDLSYDQDEISAVQAVLADRWLAMGAVTREFEAAFARFTGARHALAVTNGTAALHLALLALGIGPGDEVLLPALTFVASANAVLYCGASVRFVDILSPGELNLSPTAIAAALTPRSRAILAVHYAGYPCRMGEILAVAARHGLAVIEDAAHAPGAWLDGKHLGTWGDLGCFSFFANKNLATGEGGMIVTDRDDLAEKVTLLRSHGMTSPTWDRHRGHASGYDVIELGYNYRFDELRSALGLVQLARLPANNRRREALTRQYWSELVEAGELGLELPFRQARGQPAYHLMAVLLPAGVERQELVQRLRSCGIQTSVHYPPVHRFRYYRERYPSNALSITEAVAARQLTLPLYPGMDEEQVTTVTAQLKSCLQTLVCQKRE